MATYVTGDGSPHAMATAESKKKAANEAFEKLLEYNERTDIDVVDILNRGPNTENPQSKVLEIVYDPHDGYKNLDVPTDYPSITADAIEVLPNGDIPADEEEYRNNDLQWRVTIVDELRHEDE